tara:strand:+ start:186 stop:512 length:327 start_codon:yes stop_codon:yes gene_type:complete
MNQSVSISPKNYTMISLNVPNYLKNNLDNICKFKRFSRTSLLVRLMESYLRYEHNQLKKDNELNNLVTTLSKRNIKSEPTKKEPPMIPYSSDNEFMDDDWWNNRLKNL